MQTVVDRQSILKANLLKVLDAVKNAAETINRKVFDIKLIAVSKKMPIEDIRMLSECGHRIFGENYVQELLEKSEKLPELEWHFIGALQENKIKKLVTIPNIWIDTLDSMKKAKKVNEEASKLNKVINVFIQVNTSAEESKMRKYSSI